MTSHTEESRQSIARDDKPRMERMLAAAQRLKSGYASVCDPHVRLARMRARVGSCVAAALEAGTQYACHFPARPGGGARGEAPGPAVADVPPDCVVTTVPCEGGGSGSTRTIVVACVVRPNDAKRLERTRVLGASVDAHLRAIAPHSDEANQRHEEVEPLDRTPPHHTHLEPQQRRNGARKPSPPGTPTCIPHV